MKLLGDDADVDLLATACFASADWLADIGRRWADRVETAQWQCKKADHHRRIARDRKYNAEIHALGLRQLARDLRHHATWIRDRTGQLNAFEDLVRGWFDSGAADAKVPPGQPPCERPAYPARGDPDWQNVIDKLRRDGADI